MQSTKEIWKAIPNYEGIYEVSNLGRVKSLKFKNPLILKQQPMKRGGYLKVELHKDFIQKTHPVHKLVINTFRPAEQDCSLVIDHINNIRTDNRLSNLQRVTTKVNCTKDAKHKNGFPGIYITKHGRYSIRFKIYEENGIRRSGYFGTFKTKNEAINRSSEVIKQIGYGK